MDCIFCKIATGKLDANIIYEDDHVVAFDDLYPKAPHHKLIIPREHFATLNDMNEANQELVGHLMITAKNLAQKLDIAESGYRIAMNVNKGGGQEIFHVHLHLLGGRKLTWPPG